MPDNQLSLVSILVAPCGMNCSICAGYLAFKHDIRSQGVRSPYCPGCLPRDKRCAYLRKSCQPLTTNSVRFCHECIDFPCKHLKTIDARYRARYRMSMIENLLTIKKEGILHLLQNEESKWKCPHCGGTICCHNGICYNCGVELLRNKKKIFRWDED
jgi:hypothetical protein